MDIFEDVEEIVGPARTPTASLPPKSYVKSWTEITAFSKGGRPATYLHYGFFFFFVDN